MESVHATDLTTILPIHTIHRPHHLEPHLPIDLHVRHHFRALQIALHALLVRLIRDHLEQFPPESFPLRIGPHGDDVAEVVSAGIGPDGLLRFLLSGFPDPVAPRVEAAVAEVADVGEELAEGEEPGLEPGVPGLWDRSGARGEPAGDS